MRSLQLAAVAATLATAPAYADDLLPKACEPAYVVAVLGSVMNICKDLRVTGQGLLLGKKLMDGNSPDCEAQAKNAVEMETLQIVVKANGDATEGTRRWCDRAQSMFEVAFPSYSIVEKR